MSDDYYSQIFGKRRSRLPTKAQSLRQELDSMGIKNKVKPSKSYKDSSCIEFDTVGQAKKAETKIRNKTSYVLWIEGRSVCVVR